MKTFIRAGSFYQSETPALDGDLDITELLPTPQAVNCTCKEEVEKLYNDIDARITSAVNNALQSVKPVVEKVKTKAAPKPVVKKSAVKKK